MQLTIAIPIGTTAPRKNTAMDRKLFLLRAYALKDENTRPIPKRQRYEHATCNATWLITDLLVVETVLGIPHTSPSLSQRNYGVVVSSGGSKSKSIGRVVHYLYQ